MRNSLEYIYDNSGAILLSAHVPTAIMVLRSQLQYINTCKSRHCIQTIHSALTDLHFQPNFMRRSYEFHTIDTRIGISMLVHVPTPLLHNSAYAAAMGLNS
eukprot:scaffold29451_cov38-Cyclotella_meneghiniana.AAC.1